MRNLNVRSQNAVEMTDALYQELSLGQSFIAAVAEAVKVKVTISEYQGRKFVSQETINAAFDALKPVLK